MRAAWRALFDEVRREGRWLLTPASAVSQPSEAFFIGEMLRTGDGLALVAEADGDPIGTVQISLERNVVSSHVGTLSIVVADAWREVGIGSALVRAAQAMGARPGPAEGGAWPSFRTTRAPSPCTSTPASSARGCGASSTAPTAACCATSC